MSVDIQIDEDVATFRAAGQLAGEYVLTDRFKPHFRLLLTPAGHNTVVVSPGDHRHHKGLMYALRCADLNFWEEDPGPECGVQEILTTDPIPNGIRQHLLWRALDGGLETYRETREITLTTSPGDAVFQWHWVSQREALRDHSLIQSQWSTQLPNGRLINYHGLGIRLPWMWRFPAPWAGGVTVEGKITDPITACGTTGPEVGFTGVMDGQWQRTSAIVTLRQSHGFTWFVHRGDFPYLAVGPSNAAPVSVATGQTFKESYAILVSDISPNH